MAGSAQPFVPGGFELRGGSGFLTTRFESVCVLIIECHMFAACRLTEADLLEDLGQLFETIGPRQQKHR